MIDQNNNALSCFFVFTGQRFVKRSIIVWKWKAEEEEKEAKWKASCTVFHRTSTNVCMNMYTSMRDRTI